MKASSKQQQQSKIKLHKPLTMRVRRSLRNHQSSTKNIKASSPTSRNNGCSELNAKVAPSRSAKKANNANVMESKHAEATESTENPTNHHSSSITKVHLNINFKFYRKYIMGNICNCGKRLGYIWFFQYFYSIFWIIIFIGYYFVLKFPSTFN